MSESTDWALLARYLSNECSEEEKAEVEAYLALDPENRQLAASMKAVWDTPEPRRETSDVSRLWDEVAEKAGISARPEVLSHKGIVSRVVEWWQPGAPQIRVYAAAAVLLITTSLAFLWASEMVTFPWDSQAAQFETRTVANGARDKLILADGTRITLDAGSRLRYPEVFSGDTRDVFLSGEGYFEVASDAEKPFVVHADRAVVKVLGTRFNMRAWQMDKTVTVAVVEGKVSLGSEETVQESVVIANGQASTLPESGPPAEPYPVDIEKHMGWMRNEVFFERAPLGEILYQLERWHNVRFVLEDSSIAAEQLTVHIRGKALDDVLELISVLTGLDYQRTGGSIQLSLKDNES